MLGLSEAEGRVEVLPVTLSEQNTFKDEFYFEILHRAKGKIELVADNGVKAISERD